MGALKKFYDFMHQSTSNLNVNASVLFPVLLAAVVVLGVGCYFSFYLTRCSKLKVWSRKIVSYLKGVESVEKEDEEFFTTTFFRKGCPSSLRRAWLLFLDERRGYVSKKVSVESVFEKEKKNVMLPLFVYGATSFVLICAVGIFLSGAADLEVLFLAMLTSLLLAALIVVALFFLFNNMLKKAYNEFCMLQDELDSKVLIQNICEVYPDTSGLNEIAQELEKMATRVDSYKLPDSLSDMSDYFHDDEKQSDETVKSDEQVAIEEESSAKTSSKKKAKGKKAEKESKNENEDKTEESKEVEAEIDEVEVKDDEIKEDESAIENTSDDIFDLSDEEMDAYLDNLKADEKQLEEQEIALDDEIVEEQSESKSSKKVKKKEKSKDKEKNKDKEKK